MHALVDRVTGWFSFRVTNNKRGETLAGIAAELWADAEARFSGIPGMDPAPIITHDGAYSGFLPIDANLVSDPTL